MDYKRIALLLEDQLKLAAQREEELLKVIADQNEQLNILTAEVKSLNSSILSLEKALLEKNASLEGQQSKVRILGKNNKRLKAALFRQSRKNNIKLYKI